MLKKKHRTIIVEKQIEMIYVNNTPVILWINECISFILYSLSVATGGVVSLDDGHPRKANLLARQEHYYSFTIPTGASNILHVQVQSIEPYRGSNGINNLKTSISRIQPENGISYDCPCSDIVFMDSFTTTNYPCELTSRAGTYYIKVRALFEGADFPHDPISYTVRVWWTPIQSVTLSLGTTFTKVPQPLNYNQWIDYSITVPSGIGANQVLAIEIADITDSSLTNGNDGILASLVTMELPVLITSGDCGLLVKLFLDAIVRLALWPILMVLNLLFLTMSCILLSLLLVILVEIPST